MELTSEQKERLTYALCKAFGIDDLKRLVDFRLDEKAGFSIRWGTLLNAATDLVDWCTKFGAIGELVVNARSMNPGNAALKAFAEGYPLPTLERTKTAGPERLVLRNSQFTNVEQWIARMSSCLRAVCRIETTTGVAVGTGFLIGPRHVITNAHVPDVRTDDVRAAGPRPDLRFNFGYRYDQNGVTMAPSEIFQPAQDDRWLAACSPEKDLDFAVMRTWTEVAGQARIPLRPVAAAFEPDEALLMIQHPKGSQLKLALGSLLPATVPGRITYAVNSLEGSSGAPVFNSDLDVVALHSYGDPLGNRGVPFSIILPELRNVLTTELPGI